MPPKKVRKKGKSPAASKKKPRVKKGKSKTKGKPKSKKLTTAEKKLKENEKKDIEAKEVAEAKQNALIEVGQKSIRLSQLKDSSELFMTYDRVYFSYLQHLRRLREWEAYTACWNTSNVGVLRDVNEYMAYWTEMLTTGGLEELIQHTPEIIMMLTEMKNMLEIPYDDVDVEALTDLGILYQEFKFKQAEFIDKATLKMITDLSEDYDPEVGFFEKAEETKQIAHCLWGNVFACPEHNGHGFKNHGFTFRVPESLLKTSGIYRLVKTDYDHYSDFNYSYYPPGVNNPLKKCIDNWLISKNRKVEIPPEFPNASSDDDGHEKRKKKMKKRKKKKGKKGKKPGKSTTETSGSDSEMDGEGIGRNGKKKKGRKTAKSKSKKLNYTEEEGESVYEGENEVEIVKPKKKKKGKKTTKSKKSKKGTKETETGTETKSEKESETEHKGESEYEGETEPVKSKRKKKVKFQKKSSQTDDEDDDEFDSEGQAGVDKSKKKSKKFIKEEKRKSSDLDGLDDDFDLETNTDLTEKKSKSKEESRNKSQEEKTEKKNKKKKSKKKKTIKGKKKSKVGSKKKAGESSVTSTDDDKKGKKGGSKKKTKKKEKSKSSATSDSEETDQSNKNKKVGGKKKKKIRESDDPKTSYSETDLESLRKGSIRGGSKKKKKGLGATTATSKTDKSLMSVSKKSKKSLYDTMDESDDETTDSRSARSKKSKKKAKNSKSSKSKSKNGSKNLFSGKDKSKKKGKGKKKSKKKSKKKGKKSKSDRDGAHPKKSLKKEKDEFIVPTRANELNLRAYVILGGVYNFRVLKIPHQPRDRGDWFIHSVEADEELKDHPFDGHFAPGLPPDINDIRSGKYDKKDEVWRELKEAPDDLKGLLPKISTILPNISMFHDEAAKEAEEESVKKLYQEAMAKFEEVRQTQLKDLLYIQIQMPKKVIWFEEPKPVRWDPEFRMWNKDGFYDPTWDPETLQFSFKCDHFGILGFSQNRWINLPYQSWEFVPVGENRATLSITASKASVQFSILRDLVCLSRIKCSMPSEMVEDELLNQYMKPKLLIQRMRHHGLDIFPEFDSYAYVDGVLVKHVEAEDHLYQCIATCLPGFSFKSSKWNSSVSRSKFVYQIKEGALSNEEISISEYNLVMTSTFKTKTITCHEEDEKFSEKEPEEEKNFYADLIHLILAKGSINALNLIKETTPNFIETVRYLLYSIRPFSFS